MYSSLSLLLRNLYVAHIMLLGVPGISKAHLDCLLIPSNCFDLTWNILTHIFTITIFTVTTGRAGWTSQISTKSLLKSNMERYHCTNDDLVDVASSYPDPSR